MNFARLYRASMYLMLFLASLLLSIDSASDVSYAMLYPLAVAIAGAVAFVTVDREGGRGLPKDLIGFLGAGATIAAFAEYYGNSDLLVIALGHWIIYLQIIKYFCKKTTEDDWYLFGIGLVQVVIGVFLSQSDEVGILLLSWAITTLWAFSLFHLQRESSRISTRPGVKVVPLPNPRDPYPGLLNPGFVISALGVAATTLAMGFMIFLLMPRFPSRSGNRSGHSPGKYLTGFSDSVKLGQMGEILENDSIVMSIELLNENNETLEPPLEPLWRGVTLSSYQNKVWSRDLANWQELSNLHPVKTHGIHEVRQRVKMEATDSEVLFGLAPIVRFKSHSGNVVVNAVDGSIYRRDLRPDDLNDARSRPGPFDYTVDSDWVEGEDRDLQTHLGESKPDPTRIDELTTVPGSMEEPLNEIVKPILDAMPSDKQRSPIEIAKALERYLHDGKFTYSLQMKVVDPSLDPVLDFLINRKEGHCEYFASGLVLMCRAANVPARLVNGFKGGDWNNLGQVFVVRQKHAHSWVEVFVGTEDGYARWLVLDPTPGNQREEVVAKVGGGLTKRFRPLSDYLREQWIRRVAGLDSDRQEREIYAPIRNLLSEAKKGFEMMGTMIRRVVALFYFDDPRKFFSIRGFIVTVVTMLFLSGLLRIGMAIMRRLTGRSKLRDSLTDIDDPGLAFYNRLTHLLRKMGLERPTSETPREFAHRAAVALEGRGANDGQTSQVLSQVVEAFYEKRFGLRDLAPEFIRELETRLDALEVALTTPLTLS